jgi:hypothetical protein
MTAGSSLPASESGLALGEIHRTNIIPSGRYARQSIFSQALGAVAFKKNPRKLDIG